MSKMAFVGWDTETCAEDFSKVRAQTNVCSTLATEKGTEIFVRADAFDLFQRMRDQYTIVTHHGPFDLASLVVSVPEDKQMLVLSQVFEMLAKGQIRCTKIREQLKGIYAGNFRARKYTLADLCEKYLGRHLAKKDTWRMRYAELKDTPLDKWPQAAIDYAKTDAEVTREVYIAQSVNDKMWAVENEYGRDEETHQIQAGVALYLMGCWGVRSDKRKVRKLREELEARMVRDEESLKHAELLVPITKGRGDAKEVVGYKGSTKKVRALVEEAFSAMGTPPPTTAPSKRFPEGQVCTDKDTLLDTGSAILKQYAERSAVQKTLSFVPVLEKAVDQAFCPNWKTLVSSGRTACGNKDDPGNLQQPPVAGGVRECIVPRKGMVFAACDYATAEFRALAQICHSWFGESKMREALVKGLDIHSVLGAQLLGEDYDDFVQRLKKGDGRVKAARQQAKAGNFGFPAGMSAASYAKDARRRGFEITVGHAQTLRDAWFSAWPEMQLYFARVAEVVGSFGDGRLTQYKSGRERGNVNFCAAANSYFQGAVSDLAKNALVQVTRECWVEEGPLLGCKPVLFLHDEIIIECPEDRADSAAKRLSHVMRTAAEEWCPDVPWLTEVHLMRCWDKRAEPIFDANGKLLVWEG